MFHYWDEAWKELLNPQRPWFEKVQGYMLGYHSEVYKFVVDAGDEEAERGDPIFLIVCDSQNGVIHFDFHSYHSRDIGTEYLQYALNHVGTKTLEGDTEALYLPEVTIANVQRHGGMAEVARKVAVDSGSYSYGFSYRVMANYLCLPHLSVIAENVLWKQQAKGIKRFRNWLGTNYSDEENAQLNRICALMATPGIYTCGATHQSFIEVARALELPIYAEGVAAKAGLKAPVGKMKLE